MKFVFCDRGEMAKWMKHFMSDIKKSCEKWAGNVLREMLRDTKGLTLNCRSWKASMKRWHLDKDLKWIRNKAMSKQGNSKYNSSEMGMYLTVLLSSRKVCGVSERRVLEMRFWWGRSTSPSSWPISLDERIPPLSKSHICKRTPPGQFSPPSPLCTVLSAITSSFRQLRFESVGLTVNALEFGGGGARHWPASALVYQKFGAVPIISS